MSEMQRKLESTGSRRKATNVSLDSTHLAEARQLGINVSQACERGLVATLIEERARRWKEQNKAAMESWNRYIEERGLPLERYRLF